MGEPREPQRINSLDHLRYLIGQTPPGEGLYLEVGPNISLDDVRALWEGATIEEGEGLHEFYNPEILRGKMKAHDFIEAQIRELKCTRDHLNGYIGCMRSWCNMMKRELDNGGPQIPENHQSALMFGPRLYLDLNQIGTVEDLAQHRESILEEYFDMPVLHHSTGFWKHADTEWREKQDRRSLSKVNITILEIKIESLVLMRDRISKGIKELESLFSQRIYLGGGSADFSSFRNIILGGLDGDGMDVD